MNEDFLNKSYDLEVACQNGDLRLVRELIEEEGVDINDDYGNPLRVASQYGHLDIVKVLIEHGADLTIENDVEQEGLDEREDCQGYGYVQDNPDYRYSPLSEASHEGHLEVVKYLIEKGADVNADNDAPIRWASRNGHLEIIKLLHENGADIHANDDESIGYASTYGDVNVVKYLIDNGADVQSGENYAIINASRYGRLDVVKVLIENGANVNADHDFPISGAAKEGHIKVVKLLIENGGDLNEAIKSAHKDIKNELISFKEKALIESDMQSVKPQVVAPSRRI